MRSLSRSLFVSWAVMLGAGCAADAEFAEPDEQDVQAGVSSQALASDYFAIRAVDAATGRGVPLVELTVISTGQKFYTDSNGYLAFNAIPNANVSFRVFSYGYQRSGGDTVSYSTQLGGAVTLPLVRNNVAERLYRVTGQNLYRDSWLLGKSTPVDPLNNPANVDGQDSVQTVVFKNKLYWFWGDTIIDTGNDGADAWGFNGRVTGATSALLPSTTFDPMKGVNLSYFTSGGLPKQLFPASTFLDHALYWVFAPMVVRDAANNEHLVAYYEQVSTEAPNPVMARGFVEWDDVTQQFNKLGNFPISSPIYPYNRAFPVTVGNEPYFYFAEELPNVRVRAGYDSFNTVTNIDNYETYSPLKPGTTFQHDEYAYPLISTTPDPNKLDASDFERDGAGKPVWSWKKGVQRLTGQDVYTMASGTWTVPALVAWSDVPYSFANLDNGAEHVAAKKTAVYWNDYRQAWSMILEQAWGTSMLGELWYAEASSPEGPWNFAKKVVTHDRGEQDYSFYNPSLHPYFTQLSSEMYLLFEATYTKMFTGTPATPDYDYNNQVYRLDLADPRLRGLNDGRGLTVQYFNGSNFNTFVSAVHDQQVNAAWGTGAPAAGVNSDNFSSRWTGLVEATATGSHTFTASVSAGDGVRLWVNGSLIINAWSNPTQTSYSGSLSLQAGKRYSIRLEHYDAGTGSPASLRLSWRLPGSSSTVLVPAARLARSPNGLSGAYYDTATFGTLKDRRVDPTPFFEWKGSSFDPAKTEDGDTFSVRWTGQLRPDFNENYGFIVTAEPDDKLRIWVDGQLVLDNWSVVQPYPRLSSTMALKAGRLHDFKIEYAEQLNQAAIRIYWSSPSQTPGGYGFALIPTQNLTAAFVP